MLEQVNNDPTLIKGIITGAETWVYEFDRKKKSYNLIKNLDFANSFHGL